MKELIFFLNIIEESKLLQTVTFLFLDTLIVESILLR